jgi:hypothetical protein
VADATTGWADALARWLRNLAEPATPMAAIAANATTEQTAIRPAKTQPAGKNFFEADSLDTKILL